MRKSLLVLAFASILSALATGCMPNTMPAIAFEPRAYPYIPGPGLTNSESPNSQTNTVQR